jgi:hypothetical protein
MNRLFLDIFPSGFLQKIQPNQVKICPNKEEVSVFTVVDSIDSQENKIPTPINHPNTVFSYSL